MQKRADAMDMEKSASRFKFFDTARIFGCIFFVKMENWHIGRHKEDCICQAMHKKKLEKGRKGMSDSPRLKAGACFDERK